MREHRAKCGNNGQHFMARDSFQVKQGLGTSLEQQFSDKNGGMDFA